jgi:hypothetical protein
LQPQHELQHLLGLRDAQGGRRLVEDAPASGSPSSAREIATDWRWPPDSVPTSARTFGSRTDSDRSSDVACSSIAISSMNAAALAPRRPRYRFATTSRLSHSARS